jgi:hypothetical protein
LRGKKVTTFLRKKGQKLSYLNNDLGNPFLFIYFKLKKIQCEEEYKGYLIGKNVQKLPYFEEEKKVRSCHI